MQTNTVVSRYYDTAGIRKSIIIDYRNIQYKFLILCNSWDIDLVS